MNAVRLPVGLRLWQRDGTACLDRVGAVVRKANESSLVVILAAVDDSAARTGLPGPEFAVIFSLYHEPSAAALPGAAAGWQIWRRGASFRTAAPLWGCRRS
jgi:hypothetical protein